MKDYYLIGPPKAEGFFMGGYLVRPICLCAVVALAGCSPPPIDITSEKADGSIVLAFSQDWGFVLSDRKVPCIDAIWVHRDETFDYDNAAWAIKVDGNKQCLDLATVTIGQVPEGWQEQSQVDIQSGQTYTVEVFGIGSGIETFKM